MKLLVIEGQDERLTGLDMAALSAAVAQWKGQRSYRECEARSGVSHDVIWNVVNYQVRGFDVNPETLVALCKVMKRSVKDFLR